MGTVLAIRTLLPALILMVSKVLTQSDVRLCYKCEGGQPCIDGTGSMEKCLIGVRHCVKKETHDKVTGVSVVERHCGGQAFGEEYDVGLQDGCYALDHDEGRRTTSLSCYCSHNYCNSAIMPQTIGIARLCLVLCLILTWGLV